jgi:hypothetical protein
MSDRPRTLEDEKVTLIVNGSPVVLEIAASDRLGPLAHWALYREQYDWTTFELRDAEGHLLLPSMRPVGGATYWVTKPIGWGG